ncbi:MAG: dipeptidase [Gammaproteobacteria bacterium]|nr:dipeptidase [Gammaproteobacteria bacterium]
MAGMVCSALLFAACDRSVEGTNEARDLAAEARRIAASSIIVDTHIDVPYRIEAQPDDISVATDSGDFDYPRAVSGGLNAAFMSIYTPAELEAENASREAAEQLIDLVEAFVNAAPDKFAIALSVSDVREHFSRGLISLPLGMENGSPIEGDLANVQHFFDRGIRYITLTHSLSNHISDSSYDDNKQWMGLSEFGAEVVKEMNRLGIMVDVSHLSDDAFWQVLDITEAPVIASHSSSRHFTPGFERNMDDDMIRALGENGGVIQINFGSSFLTQAAEEYGTAKWIEGDAFSAEHPELDESEAELRFDKLYEAEHGPFPFATLDDVLDHIDHVVRLVGVDHVGIGSDFDGVGDTLPIGLKDVSTYPNLIEGLLKRGYSEAHIRKILGENLLRVWDTVAAYAAAKN